MINKIKNRLTSLEGIKYFKNFSFLFLEKSIRLIISFLIISQISRYIGPDKYGILSIVESIFSILIAISALGLDPMIIKHLQLKKYSEQEILGTAFLFKLLASFITVLSFIIIIYNFIDDSNLRLGAYILFPAIFFSSLNVIDYYYQYKVESKLTASLRTLSFISSALLKGVVIFYSLEWTYLFYAILFDQFLTAFLYFLNKPKSFKLSFSKKLSLELFNSSFYLTISSISIIFLSRVDQVMIKSMLTNFDLGNYAAAQKIVEISYIFPALLINSILPKIVEKLNSSESQESIFLSKLFKIIALTSILITAIIFILKKKIILLVFGNDFSLSSELLGVYSFSVFFFSIKIAFQQVLYAKGLEKNLMFQSIFTLIINIILNYILINLYGVIGAVYATLISIIFSAFIYDFFDKDLRKYIKYKFLLVK